MDRDDLTLDYDDKSIYVHVLDDVPESASAHLNDFLVYVMGPYTPFDLTYAFPDEEFAPDSPYVDGSLFDPDEHEDMEETLRKICDELRDEPEVRAFVATHVDIPTTREARKTPRAEDGLSPLDQSIEFAKISDAVVFVLDESGLNAGVGSEIGAILGEFDLRLRNPEPKRKPRRRFRIYCSEAFASASIAEIPYGFGVDVYRYESETELLENLRNFLTSVEYASRFENLPLYTPPEN